MEFLKKMFDPMDVFDTRRPTPVVALYREYPSRLIRPWRTYWSRICTQSSASRLHYRRRIVSDTLIVSVLVIVVVILPGTDIVAMSKDDRIHRAYNSVPVFTHFSLSTASVSAVF